MHGPLCRLQLLTWKLRVCHHIRHHGVVADESRLVFHKRTVFGVKHSQDETHN